MPEVTMTSNHGWIEPASTSNAISESAENNGRLSKVIDSIKQFATVSEVMRVFGAIVMVASMSMFLAQGWTDQNDVQRYLKLLTQTGLLAAVGLLLSTMLKEYRGARMFFGLSLVSIPVNFTVIGALFYSAFSVGPISAGLPVFAQWTIAEGMNIGFVTLGAFAAILPVTWFAFRIMARRSASKLTIAFVILNAALLFPVRAGFGLTVVFLLTAAAALILERRLVRNDETLTTPGGVFSRVLLFVPALLIFARSAGFYTFDPLLNVVAAAGMYAVSRYFANTLASENLSSTLLRGVQAISGFATAFLALQFVSSGGELANGLIAANVVLALLMIDYRAVRPAMLSGLVIIGAAVVGSTSAVLSMVFMPSVTVTFAAIAMGMFLVGYGVAFKQKLFLLLGGSVLAATSFYAIGNISTLLMESGWVGLGILGGVTIVGASFLDRYGATVKLYFSGLSAEKE